MKGKKGGKARQKVKSGKKCIIVTAEQVESFKHTLSDAGKKTGKAMAKSGQAVALGTTITAISLFTPGCGYYLLYEAYEAANSGVEKIKDHRNHQKYLAFEAKLDQAQNSNTPLDVLTKLANDEDKDVRKAVANNPKTPPDILTKLASDENPEIRRTVATNQNTPLQTLNKLAGDKVRSAVANNPNVPKELLAQLLGDIDVEVRAVAARVVASDPKTQGKTLRSALTMASKGGPLERLFVAQNPATPPQILTELSAYNNGDVLVAVANNPNTPPQALIALFKANKSGYGSSILMAIAKNKSLPFEILEEMLKERYSYSNSVIEAAIHSSVNNQKTPSHVLSEYSTYFVNEVRLDVAKNPNTPPEALTYLARDDELTITKIEVAKHSNTPINTLAKLAMEVDDSVRAAVAVNPKTPMDVLKTIDRINSGAKAAQNEKRPEELTKLAYDVAPAIRFMVAENKNTSSETLVMLADDKEKEVRRNVAKNPNTPLDTLKKLSQDKDSNVLYAITLRSDVPDDIKESANQAYSCTMFCTSCTSCTSGTNSYSSGGGGGTSSTRCGNCQYGCTTGCTGTSGCTTGCVSNTWCNSGISKGYKW